MTDAERYAHFCGEGPYDERPAPDPEQQLWLCRRCGTDWYGYRCWCPCCDEDDMELVP